MVTSAKARPAVKAAPAPVIKTQEVKASEPKISGFERLANVLVAIDRKAVKLPEGDKPFPFGKAIGLNGGGSVYINRGNADVRATPGTVSEWVKAGLGVARGPHGQYLRISF